MTRGRVLILLLVCGALACSCRSPTPAPPTEAPALAATHPPLSTATHTPEPSATLEPTGTPQPSVTSQSPTPTLAPSTPVPLPPTPTTGATRPEPERIVFGPDEVSATVVDEIEREGTEGVTYHPGYLVHARAGQTMEVAIVSPRGDVLLDVISADGVPLKRYVDGQSGWRGTLYATQDYILQPVATGASSSFTLTLRIALPEATPTPPYVAGPERIVFAPGATAAAVAGYIERVGSEGVVYHRGYLVRARAGQMMEVVVESPNGDVLLNVISADGVPLKRYVDGASRWVGELYATQDYLLQPVATGASTSFSLVVRIPPLTPTPSPQPERIVFLPGDTSAIVSGRIERHTTDGVSCHAGYLARALARQVMEVVVDSPNGDVLLSIIGEDGVPLKRYVDGASQWRGTLPATQDYFVQPVATGGSTDFTVRIIILSLESAPQRIQFASGATSATTSGRFVAGMSQYYVLRAQAGQRMTVMVDPPQVKVTIEGEDGSTWLAAPVGAGLTIPSLPQAQDYTIGLSLPLQIGEIAGYTMEVSVTGP